MKLRVLINILTVSFLRTHGQSLPINGGSWVERMAARLNHLLRHISQRSASMPSWLSMVLKDDTDVNVVQSEAADGVLAHAEQDQEEGEEE